MGGVLSKNVFAGVVVPKNDNNSNPKDAEKTFDETRETCHGCLEPGHRWFDCTSHDILATMKSHNGSIEHIGCLPIRMTGKKDAV